LSQRLAELASSQGDPPTVESVVVNDGSAQRSMVNRLTITFDRQETFDPGAFDLQRMGWGEVALSIATSVVNGRTVSVLTFTGPGVVGGSLADGNYTLTIRGEQIRDLEGRELDGDADGNGGGDRGDGFQTTGSGCSTRSRSCAASGAAWLRRRSVSTSPPVGSYRQASPTSSGRSHGRWSSGCKRS
jgi:hypothetical protein